MEEPKQRQINKTIKFLCSYGGKILPRPTDGKLRYAGGHTRVLAADPFISFSELMVKLSELCGSSVTLRCPLPNGDLETLISIKNDEDLKNVIEEYDRASSLLAHPLKIRAILSPPMCLKKLSSTQSASSSSSTAPSPTGSPHSSPESPPYTAAKPFLRQRCSPFGYSLDVRNGCCWRAGQFDGSPRFRYRRPHSIYYCH